MPNEELNEELNENQTNENETTLNYSFSFNVPNVQPLNITPSIESQEIYAPDGISGYSPVNVEAVTSDIDANIQPSNILEGTSILGVEGTAIELKGEEKTINPSTNEQIITPDENFNGITKVTVNPVTSAIDGDIKPQNILEGVNILGVNGSAVELKAESKNVNLTNKDGQTYTPTEGKNGISSITVQPRNKNVTVNPSTSSQTIGIDAGYSGNGEINVNAVTKTIDANIQANNIKKGVSILGVTGNVEELKGEVKNVTLTSKNPQTFTPSNDKNGLTSITVTAHNENRIVNPSTTAQTLQINAGYSGNGAILVNPVTNTIDSDIKPENIRQGINILGVPGSLATAVNNTDLSVNPSTSEQTFNVESPYTGYGQVTVAPVTNSIDNNITASNIKDGVTILGVEGSVVESNTTTLNVTENGTYTPESPYNGFSSIDVEVDTVNNTDLSITPLTSSQSFTASSPYTGYGTVEIGAVTSSIDANIQASNIKSGVTILGTTGNVTELNADSLTVTPSTSSQTITPTSPKNGFNEVAVNPVTSSIDANITAENIKSGVTILGVNGSVTELNGQTKTVTPTTSQQTITPDSPKNGLTSVTVDAVTSSIDSNITAGNIKDGVTILGVEGNVVELNGSSRSVTLTASNGQTFSPESGKNAITSITVAPNNENRTVTPTTSQQTLNVNSGYSGNGTITVNAVTSSIDSNISASNIKSGVTILGVNGSVVELNGQTKTVNPTTSQQTITPDSPKNGLTSVTVNAVTSSIDSNIQAENIKKDVTILGVTGTLESGGSGIISNINNNYIVRTNGNIELLTNGTYTLPVDASSISSNANFDSAYKDDTTIDKLEINSVTVIDATYTSLPRLQNSFKNSSISEVSFANLIEIKNESCFDEAFFQCTNLIKINFPELAKLSAEAIFSFTFDGCTNLTSVEFPKLHTINKRSIFSHSFDGCTSLTTLSFPALKSTSFGSYVNQLNTMLSGVTGCTVHFPSNLQSVIGSWAGVQNGFGGTNTTVLFDLPATT